VCGSPVSNFGMITNSDPDLAAMTLTLISPGRFGDGEKS
jgi:hypothetical protein